MVSRTKAGITEISYSTWFLNDVSSYMDSYMNIHMQLNNKTARSSPWFFVSDCTETKNCLFIMAIFWIYIPVDQCSTWPIHRRGATRWLFDALNS
jgi:hypothetical protein